MTLANATFAQTRPLQSDTDTSFLCKLEPEVVFTRARNGDPDALYRVGNVLDFCDPKDHEDAARHFLRAARQGHLKSVLRIGRKYMMGIGVPRNDREAFFWLSLGKRLYLTAPNKPPELGPNLAYVDTDLENIADSLSQGEIRDTLARVGRWKPEPKTYSP